MAITRTRVALVISLSLAAAAPGVAEPLALPHPHLRRVRTLHPQLEALIEQGFRESATFRALLARVEQSDVIVYVLPDASARSGAAGRLTFLSATGGVRYVAVRLRALGSAVREVALLAHELQHAVEIAERASIVDEETLTQEYRRIGQANPSMPRGTAFDTHAAVDAGHQVYRELVSIETAPDIHATGE